MQNKIPTLCFSVLFKAACLLILCQTALRADNSHIPSDSIKTEILHLSTENALLEGSLSYIESDHITPLVLFISGSGPTDRDGNQTEMKNDCFKLLAKELAQNDIASFRFDKRGVGQSSNTIDAQDLRFHHFVDDISAWFEYLRAYDRFSHIIIAGHSLGSLMGVLVCKSVDADAFISLAGPGKSLDSIMYEQIYNQSPFLAKGAKPILDSLKQGFTVKEVHPFLANLFPKVLHNYLISVFQIDPAHEIADLQIPILILQGSHDLQTPLADAYILQKAALNAELKIIEGMNHVLKNAPEERIANLSSYSDPKLPVNKQLVETMIEFIKELN